MPYFLSARHSILSLKDPETYQLFGREPLTEPLWDIHRVEHFTGGRAFSTLNEFGQVVGIIDVESDAL